MRRYWTLALIILPVVALAACSAHPLPEDTTRKSTFAIVQQLRCEARDGIIEAVRDKQLTQQQLASTYIGFDFNFDITESNKANSGSLVLTNPLSDGKFVLNFKGGAERTRQAGRFFRVVQLLKDLHDDKNCGSAAPYANLAYPITGRIGLREVIGTYAALKEVTKLRRRGEKDKSVFSDELAFTTQLDAGITPSLEVSAGAGAIKLTKASIDGSVQRKDIHKITIAIAGIADVTDIATATRTFTLRAGPSPGLGTGAANVIQELDRLRNRNDDTRVLESLKAFQ